MDINDVETKTGKNILPTEIYDLYAPALYGKILSIVHKEPIANKVLHDVFINVYKNTISSQYTLQTPLISMLNQARENSYKTIKALILFRECCSGASVHITEKK